MCFNLFGDLAADLGLADRAVHTWWPDVPGTVSDIRFAHSPGRLDAQGPEQLRMAQRQLDHLAYASDFLVQTADVPIGNPERALLACGAGRAASAKSYPGPSEKAARKGVARVGLHGRSCAISLGAGPNQFSMHLIVAV